ncbi:MAG: hypothetical protein BWY77_01513 [bacterium ADurb.Bin431]|nr:MAG: hypothetical protein BWY77_01513 [bacterium ADurb.Bin431]
MHVSGHAGQEEQEQDGQEEQRDRMDPRPAAGNVHALLPTREKGIHREGQHLEHSLVEEAETPLRGVDQGQSLDPGRPGLRHRHPGQGPQGAVDEPKGEWGLCAKKEFGPAIAVDILDQQRLAAAPGVGKGGYAQPAPLGISAQDYGMVGKVAGDDLRRAVEIHILDQKTVNRGHPARIIQLTLDRQGEAIKGIKTRLLTVRADQRKGGGDDLRQKIAVQIGEFDVDVRRFTPEGPFGQNPPIAGQDGHIAAVAAEGTEKRTVRSPAQGDDQLHTAVSIQVGRCDLCEHGGEGEVEEGRLGRQIIGEEGARLPIGAGVEMDEQIRPVVAVDITKRR